MFSRRAGHNLVRHLHIPANTHRRFIWLAVVLIAVSAFGVSDLSANWRAIDKKTSFLPPFPKAARKNLVLTARRDIASSMVTTVSAASFEPTPVAPESIVAAFGSKIANQTATAFDTDPNTPGIQLPTELAGTTVEVNGRRAGLFFVSQDQINFVMPAATETGAASVVIKTGDVISSGTVQVATAAPAIFTANSTGRGVAAATLLRVKTNGTQTYESISQPNPSQIPGSSPFITKPIDAGPEGERVFLVLFLSGMRRASDPNGDGNLNESIRVLIGGIEVTPLYAGRQGDYVGLDQVNVEIPRVLIGRGIVSVSVSATGFSSSNLVNIEMAGAGSSTPPQIMGFGSSSALAGQTLIINGNGFSTNPSDNTVRIAGLEAEVMNASPTQLTVMVPFGVESGTVSVRTATGEGISTNVLRVRTSISGFVEDTTRQPMEGVTVRLLSQSPPIVTTTNAEGSFVLPDILQAGNHTVEIDGNSLDAVPPFPRVTLKIPAHLNRDNQLSRAVALQQATGSGTTIGSGSGSLTGSSGENIIFGNQNGIPNSLLTTLDIIIQTGDFKLEFPDSVTALFPNGATSGNIFLTPLLNGRTPFDLPLGYYSSSIVQITPFGVKLDPGGKLTFPNTEGFPAGLPVVLFRYDPDLGRVVEDTAKTSVSADGQRIETEAGAIKVSSYYFAAISRSTTTLTGRVFEKDGNTKVRNAVVRFRGQEASTDGNGSFVMRYVPARNGESIAVEASYVRPNGRVERTQSVNATIVIGGITRVPDILLPGARENRPPTIIAPARIETDEGKESTTKLIVTDPDVGQTVQVRVDGAAFASVIRQQVSPGTFYLMLKPDYFDSGDYILRLTANDSLGLSVRAEIRLRVNDINRPPQTRDKSVTIDEDTTATIILDAIDPDGDPLTYTLVTQPAHGTLSGDPPRLTYKPAANFNGSDRFTFRVSDGKAASNLATVSITIRPVNDPPVLTVPRSQTVNEGRQLNFIVSARDPDSDQTLTITATDQLPAGATLTPVAAGSSLFSWVPNYSQAGIYNIVFKVADSAPQPLYDFGEVQITVNDVRVLLTPDAQKVNEGQSLIFNVSTSITGGAQGIAISAQGVPEGAVLGNQTANTRQLRWTPGFTQAGEYVVKFRAFSQALGVDESRDVPISVFDSLHDLSNDPSPYTVFGAAGSAQPTTGDDPDALGASMATGDLNGDNIPDLAIGAPFANGRGANSGQVYVFFGKRDLGGVVDLARQTADVTFVGEAADDRFGTSLTIGDINGDGKNDLIIGAPLANVGNMPDAGKVYAVFGNLTAGAFEIEKAAGVTILGQQRNDRFGTSVATGFIHTKNGPSADLIVGAPGFDPTVSGGTQLLDAGAVYGFFGNRTLPKTIDSRSGSSFAVTGAIAGANLGTTLAVGNFNGDDFADFAMGAPLAGKSNGAVYLALGAERIDMSLPNALQVFNGPDEGDHLGAALAIGDINGDGKADLIIGAPGGDGPGNSRPDAGEVYVIYGGANITSRTADLVIYGVQMAGDEVPDRLGACLAVGDFTGDGIVDLVIGAPGADRVDLKRKASGAVYVVFGGPPVLSGVFDFSEKPADLSVYGADPGDNLGDGSVVIGNINSTEPADLILGIPLASSLNNSRPGAGEVRVLWGVKR